MIIFDINERGDLMVDAKTLTVDAFYQLYKSDKAPNKLNAVKLLKYVFFMGDITEKNPHRDIAYHLREDFAKKDVFGDAKFKFSKKEEDMVNNAIKWYYTLNRDSVDRLAIAVNRQVDQITNMLETSEDLTLTNYKDRIDLMKDIKNILISKTQTDEFVEKSKKKAKTKGNAARSPMEMGLVLTQLSDVSEIE